LVGVFFGACCAVYAGDYVLMVTLDGWRAFGGSGIAPWRTGAAFRSLTWLPHDYCLNGVYRDKPRGTTADTTSCLVHGIADVPYVYSRFVPAFC